MRKRWWTMARLVISLGLLSFVLLTIGLERIGRILLEAEPGPLLIAFALFITGLIVRALRWRALLVGLGLRVPLGKLIYLYFASTFFSTFLPTAFGGDVVRVMELSQEAQTAAAFGTVLVDRLTGLLALFAMALLALPFGMGLLPQEVWLPIGALAASGLIVGGLILHGRWLRRLGRWLPGPLALTGDRPLARAYDAVTACGWRAVGQALFMSFIFNTLLVVENYSAAQAVGVRLSLTHYFIFVPVLSLTLMLPISIGGLGVREGMAVVLFTQVGVDEALAVAFSLAIYAIARVTGLFGGLIYLLQSIRVLRQGAGGNAVYPEGDQAR